MASIINFSILILAALQICQAVEYTITNKVANTPGGIRFTNEVGVDYTKQTLKLSTDFIWRIFQQSSATDRKNIQKVDVFIDTGIDGYSAYAVSNKIHVTAPYIQRYSGNVKKEITGVIFHEMTHIWQWNGNGQTNRGLIEGIADYVRLKAGYAPSHWINYGEGDRWDQGYDVTARFLDYCNSLKKGFVAELNKKMIKGYNNNFFVEILGKTVDQLWSDYKAKYNK